MATRTRLEADRYVDLLAVESDRFRAAVVEADPEARVPTCPDWTALDLLWHLTEVQDFWAGVVARRPDPPEDGDPPPRPTDEPARLLAAFDDARVRLVDALRGLSPDEPAWSWAEDQTVGFTQRRQTHEALVHRVDAELTAGLPVTEADSGLAADGVHEALTVMLGGAPPWSEVRLTGARVAVEADDTGHRTVMALARFTGTSPRSGRDFDEPTMVEVEPDSVAGTVVRGPAWRLDRWLWHRADTDGLRVSGDQEAWAAFVRLRDEDIE